jgi:hypothetical protein
MKTLISAFATAVLLLLPTGAAEPQKPLVTLTVKRQVLDSDHDLRGRGGDTRQKTVTLRVEISNTSQAPVGDSELSGDVLVKRVRNEQEKIVREPLPSIKVPAMKPGESLIFDLGKIELSEIEWRNRKFEEALEEWQVTSTSRDVEIGRAVSSDRHETLSKEAVEISKKDGPDKPRRKGPKRQAK